MRKVQTVSLGRAGLKMAAQSRLLEDPNTGRFSGAAGGQEYDIIEKAMPHYQIIQERVCGLIKKHLADRDEGSFRFLEIGCGSGLTTEQILEADSRIELDAIDNEPAMIQACINRVGSNDRVWVALGDAYCYIQCLVLPVWDGVVMSNTAHNFFPDYRCRVMKAIARTMKPEGILIIPDKWPHDDHDEYTRAYTAQVAAYDVFDQMGRSDLKELWIQHDIEDDGHRVTVGQGRECLERLGFDQIRFVERHWRDAICVAIKKEKG